MRNLFLLFITIFLCLSLSAQIIINLKDSIKMGRYPYAIDLNVADTLFNFDTTCTNCVWDFRQLQEDEYDTLIVRPAVEGEFWNVIPQATHVINYSKYPDIENYFRYDTNGTISLGFSLPYFCFKKQLMNYIYVTNNFTFPLYLNKHYHDTTIWESPKCRNLSNDSTLIDSSYTWQSDITNSRFAAAGIIRFTNNVSIPALMSIQKSSVIIKEFFYTNTDTLGWRIKDSISFSLPNTYGFYATGYGNRILFTNSWGLSDQKIYHMPSSFFTNAQQKVYKNHTFILPNPANNYIKFNTPKPLINVTLIDTKGKQFEMVLSAYHEYDIRHLPVGLYFLHAFAEDGSVYTGKFIKE